LIVSLFYSLETRGERPVAEVNPKKSFIMATYRAHLRTMATRTFWVGLQPTINFGESAKKRIGILIFEHNLSGGGQLRDWRT
jgi:hypothetical protein